MVKNDFVKLFTDAKDVYLFSKQWAKKNYIALLIILVVYSSLFFADPIIRNWSLNHHNSIFDFIFNIGHLYGKLHLTFASFVVLYFGGILFRNYRVREWGWKILEAFIISGIIVTAVKSILGRWRPYTGHGNFAFYFFTFGPNDHLSLPSGDVAVAFAFSTIVAGFFDNKIWKIFWFGMAVITALGRIYHDQHWLTDVILASVISIFVGNVVNNNSRFKPGLK